MVRKALLTGLCLLLAACTVAPPTPILTVTSRPTSTVIPHPAASNHVALPTPTSAHSPVSPPTPMPSPEEVLSRGQEVRRFHVCLESTAFTRPPEEVQAKKVWENPRYALSEVRDPATKKSLLYPWTHNFLMYYGGTTIEQDMLNLSGLWSGSVKWNCDYTWRQRALGTCVREPRTEIWAEVWVFFHRVVEIKHLGTHYVVVVEPARVGFQAIDFQRPGPVSLTLTFVTPDGQVLDRIVEGETPGTRAIGRCDKGQ